MLNDIRYDFGRLTRDNIVGTGASGCLGLEGLAAGTGRGGGGRTCAAGGDGRFCDVGGGRAGGVDDEGGVARLVAGGGGRAGLDDGRVRVVAIGF